MVRYLHNKPQHRVGETYNQKLGGAYPVGPADSARFRSWTRLFQSSLCRFEDCEHINVIKARDIRVAFDELIKYISNLNPKHSAGYVHICCLENIMVFPMLCKDLYFKPEDRALPLERAQENPMMMRDRTLYDEILRFGPRESEGRALQQWQQRSAKWFEEVKAKKNHPRDLVNARREFVARGRKEAAEMNKEKRGRREEEDSQGSDECGWSIEKRRPQPK